MKYQQIVNALLGDWSSWQPTQQDIDWTRYHLEVTTREGTKPRKFWGTQEGVFEVFHDQNKLTWISKPGYPQKPQLYWKVSRIAPMIGWRVESLDPGNN